LSRPVYAQYGHHLNSVNSTTGVVNTVNISPVAKTGGNVI